MRSVAVVTPYPEALTGPIRTDLEADGLRVPVAAGLGLTDSLEIAAVPPEAIVRFAVEPSGAARPTPSSWPAARSGGSTPGTRSPPNSACPS